MSSAWGNVFATAPSRNLFSVNTFSDLRTLTPPTGDATLEVDGRAAKNDGFGGIFYFDPNSAAADDNVNTIAPTSGAGRWIRTIVFAALGSFTNLAIGDGIQAAPSLSFSADSDTGIWRRANNVITFSNGGSSNFEIQGLNFGIGSTSLIKWGDQPTIPLISVFDTGISRTSAGIVEINNGTPGSLATLKAIKITTPLVTPPVGSTLKLGTNADSGDWEVNLSGILKPVDGFFTADLASSSVPIRSGYFGTSVVTPQVISAAGSNLQVGSGTGSGVLQLLANNTLMFQINTTGHMIPVTGDAAQNIGDPTHRILYLFTTRVDSGTTAPLSLQTNSGTEQFRIAHAATAVNLIQVYGAATTANPQFEAIGTDTNVGINFLAKGNQSHTFFTSTGAAAQFAILHTASANRNITVTGSNGGNPTINVTGGSLAITPDVVIAGASISVGTTPATAGTIRIPYGVGITSRNQANSGDRDLLKLITRNSVADVLSIAGGASIAGLELQATVRSGAPTTSDIISGTWALWRDTTGATTRLYYNNAGTLQFVALV